MTTRKRTPSDDERRGRAKPTRRGRRARKRTSDDGPPSQAEPDRSRPGHEQEARTSSSAIGSSSTRSTPRRPRRARWSRAASSSSTFFYGESGGAYPAPRLTGRQHRDVRAPVHRAPPADRLPPHRGGALGCAHRRARAVRQHVPAARRDHHAGRTAIQSGLHRHRTSRAARAVADPQRQAQRLLPRPSVRARSRRRQVRRPARRLREVREAHADRVRRAVSAARLALARRPTTPSSRTDDGQSGRASSSRPAASAPRIARSTHTARSAASRMVPLSEGAAARSTSRRNGYLPQRHASSTSITSRSSTCSAARRRIAGHVQLTNLSAGVELQAEPAAARHRRASTASTPRRSTSRPARSSQTPDTTGGCGNTIIQNEAYISPPRDELGARGCLGRARQISSGSRSRPRSRTGCAPEFTLRPPRSDASGESTCRPPRASRCGAAIVDRRSIKDARIGIDGVAIVRASAISRISAARRSSGRLFASRELARTAAASGRPRSRTRRSTTACSDDGPGLRHAGAAGDDVSDCYGTSNNTVISAGGQLFYRLKRIGSDRTLHVMRITNTRSDGAVDPAILSVTGFMRIAKRF